MARIISIRAVGERRPGGLSIAAMLAVALATGAAVALVIGSRTLAPLSPQPASMARVTPMPICGAARRVNCVVDGDTIWFRGEKIRMQGYNTPEMRGACAHERALARRAQQRLSEMLSSAQLSIERTGTDRYGRTLARVAIPRGDVGTILIGEGLAHVWQGYQQDWC
ncbi:MULTISPECIES: thermonuclease family protein [unclassified Roseitalea]|uniref:thermonuclease family protein n=1 Tax=unclassified Roseitalea TaxID=2639107 RepID=UPI00273E6233|nr:MULTISPECIES: thermonuclease family protein [unclassified Roseitalea]